MSAKRPRNRQRQPDPPPGAVRELPDPRTLLVAGAIITVASFVVYARYFVVGLAVGPAIDLAVTPFALRALGWSYRSPGAPLWSLCFAIISLVPAVGTFRIHELGLPFTAAAALPAMALGFLSWRRPLALLGRVGILVAIAALLIALVLSMVA